MSGLSQMFQEYKDRPIALYGLGVETEKALDELDGEFQIVGLLDSYRESGMLYNKPIISIKEAVDNHVALILVVARPGSCKAIARKIGSLCQKNRIDLIDVRGRDLCDVPNVTYCFKESRKATKNQLLRLVGEHDVISVDLFDTLIMREILFPADIFEILDCRLRENGIFIDDFCEKRLDSEKYLSRHFAPSLIDIYAYMKEIYALSDIAPHELAEWEWMTDCELIVPRNEICVFFKKMAEQGKKVYIVSDTYYSKEQIAKILEKCDITFYTDIFASCEYNTGKTQHLFGKLKEKIRGRNYLHVGDDIIADIKSAKESGITAYQVYSGMELLEMTGYLGLWDNIESLSDRIKVGMFAARLFNSPFQFEAEKQEISVEHVYDISYLFFAPMISDFVLWFEEQVKYYGLKNIWFCARDGYLVKKLYDELCKRNDSIYFLTSRIAAIRAGMEDEDDIRYVSEMKFSGTVKEQLRERFGITVQKIGSDYVDDADEMLADYTQDILKEAAVNRKNYKAYIGSLPMKEGAVAFFDFVAKGTSQMYIGKLLENHLKGFYFLRLEEENMKDKKLDIQPFYTAQELEASVIFDNYYILESMLTAPKPSVAGFNGQGHVYYAKETRKKEELECIKTAQKGIFDYFQTYLKLCPETERRVNKKLDEMFLALIHNITISDKTFLNLKVEDPFFNRNTDMTDLI